MTAWTSQGEWGIFGQLKKLPKTLKTHKNILFGYQGLSFPIPPPTLWTPMFESPEGPFINDVTQFWTFFDPPSPLCYALMPYRHTLPYPLPSLRDIIYEWSLASTCKSCNAKFYVPLNPIKLYTNI